MRRICGTHPAAEIFPLLPEEGLAALAANIRDRGLLQALVVERETGLLLDGRNRLAACERVGVEPRVRLVDVEDPIAFVLSANLHRRHLNESQRAMVAARIATLADGQRQVGKFADVPTQAQAAAHLGTSERSVRAARSVIETAAPEVVAAVDHGLLAVSAAAELAALEHQVQREVLEETRGDGRRVRTEIRRRQRTERINEIARGNAPLGASQRYAVIYADPAWRYEHAASESRAIENQYPTMALEEICALPVSEIATPDAVLFCWATSPLLANSLRVIEAWDFVYRTCMVWDKERLGMGYWARQQHELLLIATRGNPPAPAPAARPASVVRERRGEHSVKPDSFAALIARMFPELPRVELFARSPRPGWAVWGNQSGAAA
ncbi:MAG: MT-A70 family methyltransferase [Sandaracinaceae bacterium]